VEVSVVGRGARGNYAREDVLKDVLGLLNDDLGLVLDRVALLGFHALVYWIPAAGVSLRGALEAFEVVRRQNCKQVRRSLLMTTNEMNANKNGPLAPWCCN
jgi:hypothetical protein